MYSMPLVCGGRNSSKDTEGELGIGYGISGEQLHGSPKAKSKSRVDGKDKADEEYWIIAPETVENEREKREEIPFGDFKPRLVKDQSEIEIRQPLRLVKGHASESRRQNRTCEGSKRFSFSTTFPALAPYAGAKRRGALSLLLLPASVSADRLLLVSVGVKRVRCPFSGVAASLPDSGARLPRH
ncbi:hypothetical protein B0H10DRAFT_2201307 [Mycena sp. CBHHK59/15]|nr:hypothetical protein B0H10DRAFT_2201307 [Mycena sp. CBHHK59/15]